MRNPTAFLAALVVAAAIAPAQRPLEDLLKRLDRDGDGRLSREEFPRGEERFRQLDRDGDGFLTRADFDRGRAPAKPTPEAAKTEAAGPASSAAASAEGIAFFESKIRPVLADSCYGCHSTRATRLRGGLFLDSKPGILKGGASGPALVPGDPDASLLLQAMRYDGLRMPPKAQLAEGVVRDFETWIRMGAPDPRGEAPAPAEGAADSDPATDLASWKRPIDIAEGRKFWSFQPPRGAEAPAVARADWALGDIDRFVLAAMEEHQLAPVADASRRTWIRRVSFDLTGLPPTPEEIAAFEKDTAPDAWAKVVDRLLASPRFGERWGRHWLDVARFGESSGKETNIVYPHAWRYRDWVVAAFNADKPYDLFLKEQLAGDLMPSSDPTEAAERVIATGFLAVGPKSHNARNRQQFTMDLVDEQIDATSQAMLGLTISCARCHDHKFDPIPTEDYYALAGIFLSTETGYGTKRSQGNNHPSTLAKLAPEAALPDGPAMQPGQRAVLDRLRERAEATASGEMTPRRARPEGAPGAAPQPEPAPGTKPDASPEGGAPPARPSQSADLVNRVRVRAAREQVAIFDDLMARFDESGKALPSNRLAMAAKDARRPRDARVLVRGEIDRAAQSVPRGFPQVLRGDATPKIGDGSGRLELAQWIASPSNPLTARVMANRVWHHLFGRGIVASCDNFGTMGQAPSHPELLDWLARRFVEQKWSVKALIREIVLSRTYRLASAHDAKNAAHDPEAVWLWRMPERRLEGEAIRDAMLAVSGRIQLAPPVGSMAGTLEGPARGDFFGRFANPDSPVRSVYLPVIRDHVPEALEVFDFAEPSLVTGDREETNVATQALYMMNNAAVLKEARAFAERLAREAKSEDDRIVRAFELALGRRPDGAEKDAVRAFLREFPAGKDDAREPSESRSRRGRRPPRREAGGNASGAGDPKQEAWAAFCQALFASAEFRYVD